MFAVTRQSRLEGINPVIGTFTMSLYQLSNIRVGKTRICVSAIDEIYLGDELIKITFSNRRVKKYTKPKIVKAFHAWFAANTKYISYNVWPPESTTRALLIPDRRSARRVVESDKPDEKAKTKKKAQKYER